jgi:hypothetical protein
LKRLAGMKVKWFSKDPLFPAREKADDLKKSGDRVGHPVSVF